MHMSGESLRHAANVVTVTVVVIVIEIVIVTHRAAHLGEGNQNPGRGESRHEAGVEEVGDGPLGDLLVGLLRHEADDGAVQRQQLPALQAAGDELAGSVQDLEMGQTLNP